MIIHFALTVPSSKENLTFASRRMNNLKNKNADNAVNESYVEAL